MIGLVLVTHGTLANEFVVAIDHEAGPQNQIATIGSRASDDLASRDKDV